MNTIRTTALTVIATVACLALLLTPDSRHDVGPTEGGPPAPGNSAANSHPQAAFQFERESPTAPARDKTPPAQAMPNSLAAPRAETPPLDWPRMLYPELARIETLENRPAQDALGELLPMLSSYDPVIRLAAIESVGDMTLPATANALVAALDDPNPQLRVAAIEALASREDRSVASSIELHLYDADQDVRVAAIDALADLESESAVHALAGLLSDPDFRIRRRAVDALGDIGGESAVLYLQQARYDPVKSVRSNAEAIITELELDAAY